MYWQRLGSSALAGWRAVAAKQSALRARTLCLADRVRRRELQDAWRVWRDRAAYRRHLHSAAATIADARRRAALREAWQQWRARVASLRLQISAVVHANTMYLRGAFKEWRRHTRSAQRSLHTVAIAERVMELAQASRQPCTASVLRAWRGWTRVRTAYQA